MKKNRVSEKSIEQYFSDQVKRFGGRSYKWSSPSHRGVPDRLAFFPEGEVWCVEIKAPDGRLSALQAKTIKEFREMKVNAHVVYGKSDVDFWLDHMVENKLQGRGH